MKAVAGNWLTSLSRGEGHTLVGVCSFTRTGTGGGEMGLIWNSNSAHMLMIIVDLNAG